MPAGLGQLLTTILSVFQVGRSQVFADSWPLTQRTERRGQLTQICKRKKYDNFIQNEIKVQILEGYTFKIDYEPLKIFKGPKL